ncbi:PepSY-associated TM helix [compost metagenome]
MMRKHTNTPLQSSGLRPSMAWLHTWVGLLAGWILYAMFLTGSISYFREELTQWMQPEIPALAATHDALSTTQHGMQILQAIAPDNAQWTIELPGARGNTAYAMWLDGDGFERIAYDPLSGKRYTPRATAGGEFFYYFHFSLHYFPRTLGRWITGFCAMLMLIAIVSGIIIHKKIFTDFFTFRWGKGQRSWLDAHNAFSVLGLPFHLMISYTGLIMLMFMYMPWGRDVALTTNTERAALTAEMRAFLTPAPRSGNAMPLAPLDQMFAAADQRWGAANVERVIIANPGGASARIMLVRGNAKRVSVTPQYLLFEASKGKLLEAKDQASAAAESWGLMYGLHMGRFADTVTRWLYFIISLAGTAMVATGLVLWTVKRRQKLRTATMSPFGLKLVERLNLACIAGLSIAMSSYLWGNRLLPVDMLQRAAWEIHVFFIVWGLALLHACVRPLQRAWSEQLWLATALLALLPVLAAVTSPQASFSAIDNGALGLALLHGVLAYRVKPAGITSKQV